MATVHLERTVLSVTYFSPSRILLRYSVLTRIRQKRLVLLAWKGIAAAKMGFGHDSMLSVRLVMFYYRYLIEKAWTGLKHAKEARVRKAYLRQQAEKLGRKGYLKRTIAAMRQYLCEVRQEKTAANDLILKVLLPSKLRVVITKVQQLHRAASRYKQTLTRRALQSLYSNREKQLLERKKEIIAYRNYRKRGLTRCYGALKDRKAVEIHYFQRLEMLADGFRLGRLLALRRVGFSSLEGNVLGRGFEIRSQLRVSQKKRLISEWRQLVDHTKSLEYKAEVIIKLKKSKIFSGLCSALKKQQLNHQSAQSIQMKSELSLKEYAWSCMIGHFQKLQYLKLMETKLTRTSTDNFKRRTLGCWLDQKS